MERPHAPETDSLHLLPLCDLPVLPLLIHAEARESLRLPPHSASTLRGAFGGALRELVCVHPHREGCKGCPLEFACAYPAIFEPRAPEGTPGFSGFADLPRPYVLRGPEAPPPFGPGESWEWQATLIGRSISHLPYFVLAWRSMGERGIGSGRGKFNLTQVDRLDADGEVLELLFDGNTGRLSAPSRTEARHVNKQSPVTRELVVKFLTPTALQLRKQPVVIPEFGAFWHAVQSRLSSLQLAHGEGRPAIDFRAMLRRAEAVRLVSWEAEEMVWERYSRRQGRRVPMRGFVGQARYEGDLTPFVPALKLGTWVGIGDNCTFGLGHYELETPPIV